MPHYNTSTRQRVADINLGLRVDKATATLPQTTSSALFNVEVGRVLVNMILGEVTTVIQTQINATKLQSNPDTGTTTDMCAALDITAKEVGSLFTISGTAGTALQAGSSGSVIGQAIPVIVAAGAIELVCAASNTGYVKWSIFYVPIDDGAYVEAA